MREKAGSEVAHWREVSHSPCDKQWVGVACFPLALRFDICLPKDIPPY